MAAAAGAEEPALLRAQVHWSRRLRVERRPVEFRPVLLKEQAARRDWTLVGPALKAWKDLSEQVQFVPQVALPAPALKDCSCILCSKVARQGVQGRRRM